MHFIILSSDGIAFMHVGEMYIVYSHYVLISASTALHHITSFSIIFVSERVDLRIYSLESSFYFHLFQGASHFIVLCPDLSVSFPVSLSISYSFQFSMYKNASFGTFKVDL